MPGRKRVASDGLPRPRPLKRNAPLSFKLLESSEKQVLKRNPPLSVTVLQPLSPLNPPPVSPRETPSPFDNGDANDSELVTSLFPDLALPPPGDDIVAFSLIRASKEETEGGYLASDLYDRSNEDDDACLSTVGEFDIDVGLARWAKPTTKMGDRSLALYKIRYAWRGEIDELLDYKIRPREPAIEWEFNLLKALAKIVLYGEPAEINGLLWMKAWEKSERRNDSVVRTGDVCDVIDD